MMNTGELVREYRAQTLECVHSGMICISDTTSIVAGIGDETWQCFYRSAAKPIQALPFFMMQLQKKYGLTQEESAILSGSHYGDPEHVRVLESIMEKTGIVEDELVMLPIYPVRESEKLRLIAKGMPARKIYHNCSGKHMGLILISKELGAKEIEYWRPENVAQIEIRKIIANLADISEQEIVMGVDGCGVPVYAVPFDRIARTYAKLVCPEHITNENIAIAVKENLEGIHAYPHMISGKNNVCSIICKAPNLFAKGGAMGVYAMGVRSLGLGIVFKVLDGSQDEFAIIAAAVLEQLGVEPDIVAELKGLNPATIKNDNKVVVGEKQIAFTLSRN